MERETGYQRVAERIRALKAEGRYPEAEEEIRRELEKDPHNAFFQAGLADLWIKQGRLAEARILAEEVLARDPGQPQALSILGDFFMKRHAPADALNCYRQAFARAGGDYLILRSARALREMKRLEEALEELERVLVAKPKSVSFLREKASLLNQMKRSSDALDTFEKIRDLSPGDSFVEKEILRLKSKSMPDGQAVNELRRVLSMDSKKNDAQMHGLLAQKFRNAGLIREAAAEYKTAAALSPRDHFFLKQEGYCHYRAGDFAAATASLSEALRKDPADAIVRRTLERMYRSRGEEAAFLALLEEVFRAHPEEISLLGTIKRIRKRIDSSAKEP